MQCEYFLAHVAKALHDEVAGNTAAQEDVCAFMRALEEQLLDASVEEPSVLDVAVFDAFGPLSDDSRWSEGPLAWPDLY